MDELSCDFCSKLFLKKRSQIARSKKHFCSARCQQEARKNGKMVSCFVCGRQSYKKKKDLLRSKSKKYFCSQQCSNTWLGSQQLKNKHPNWINGEFAYKEILARENPKKQCLLCGYKNKQVIIVHHIDQNRKNNRVENLTWLCRNCHHLVHNYSEPYKQLAQKVRMYGKKKV